MCYYYDFGTFKITPKIDCVYFLCTMQALLSPYKTNLRRNV